MDEIFALFLNEIPADAVSLYQLSTSIYPQTEANEPLKPQKAVM